MRRILIIKNLLSPLLTDYVFGLAAAGDYTESKVGQRIDPEQKIRQDFFVRSMDCAPLDTAIMDGSAAAVLEEFGISLAYRERWKVGFYAGDVAGHYNPHTDTQGGMEHRQLSFVVSMSNPQDYGGGELVFPEIGQTLKPEQGTAIIFPSEMLHGVKPVTSGERHTLLSFMFDAESGAASGRELTNYIPSFADIEKPVIENEFTVSNRVAHYSNIAPTLTKAGSHADGIVEGPLPEDLAYLDTLSARFEQTNATAAQTTSQSLPLSRQQNRRYLLPLTPNSGPGNQLMGIKEALIMGEILDRTVLLPPFHQHYVAGTRSWNFDEIYHYDLPEKAIPYSPTDTKMRPKQSFVAHNNYLGEELKIEKLLALDIEEHLLQQRRFRKRIDYEELRQKNDDTLCVKHLFNNTVISRCGWNGCTECETNSKLEPLYATVSKHLDFAPPIKKFGDDFITQHFDGPFLSIHLRYPDIMNEQSLKQIAGYSESDIERVISRIANEYEIEKRNVFIATNRQHLVSESSLANYNMYDGSHEDEIEPFIEQYICCRSAVFLLSKFNDFARLKEAHQRSTWSVAVADYRKYRLSNSANLVLQDLF